LRCRELHAPSYPSQPSVESTTNHVPNQTPLMDLHVSVARLAGTGWRV